MFSLRDHLTVLVATCGTILVGMGVGTLLGSFFDQKELGAVLGCLFSFPLAQFLLVRELKRRHSSKV